MNNHACPAVVLAYARAWIGTPFVRRAASRGHGADCVGLIRGVLADLTGVHAAVPGWRGDWATSTAEPILSAANAVLVPVRLDAVTPGHVITFRVGADRTRHVGILTEGGGIIHASEHSGVTEIPGPAPWPITAAFAFPLAEWCETGAADLTAADLLAVVYADTPGGIFVQVLELENATPLSCSRLYACPASALASIPDCIENIERAD